MSSSNLPQLPPAPTGSLRLLAKAAVVGFLSLLLLIPLAMIHGAVRERQAYRTEAVNAVAESFAGPQWLAGPVLTVEVVDERDVPARDTRGEAITTVERTVQRMHWFPADLAIDGVLRHGQFVLGPELAAFENSWAGFCCCSHAIGVGSGKLKRCSRRWIWARNCSP